MKERELITKITRIFERSDNSEVKIVAEEFIGAGLTRSIGYYIHRRDKPGQEWTLCGNTPHPEWRTMSVDEYRRVGRPEMLRFVSWGEILQTISMIGAPLESIER